MFFSPRFKLITAFSLIVIFIVGVILVGSTKFPIHAAGVNSTLLKKEKLTSASRASSCGGWSYTSNTASSNSRLVAVTASSGNNVWAVGYYYNLNGTPQTLIEQWNGTNWSVIPSPNVGSQGNYLTGVTRVPGTVRMWAVGYYYDSSGNYTYPLIEQWNGTSWNVVSSPSVGVFSYLNGVVALTGHNVWAIGAYFDSSGYTYTLIEHWNGTSWNVVSSPNIGSALNVLQSITRVPGTSQVWAVGRYQDMMNATTYTLIEQWDGMNWNVVSSPNAGSNSSFLLGVSANSANNAWAVGGYSDNGGGAYTLIEQWNGTSWNIVSSPNTSPNFSYLVGVSANSANNAWAVGGYYNGIALIERWNGTGWKIVSSQPPGGISALTGVTGIPGTSQLWAVGYYTDSSAIIEQTLTAFHC